MSALLLGHAVAHLVGFAVPWRLMTSTEVPYRTTALGGALEIGPTGARLLGLGWLAVAIALGAVAAGLVFNLAWWSRAAGVTLCLSLALCTLGWPDSRFGVPANAVILTLLIVGLRRSWFA